MFGTVLGGTRGETQAGSVFTLDAVDTVACKVQRVSFDFLAHGIAFDPRLASRLATFEKRGPGGAVVNVAPDGALTVERRVLPSPGRRFYGHAAFSGDGKQVFVVESDLASHQGVMTIREGQTLALRGEFPTYGADPHDCVLLEDKRTLCITNAGGTLGSNDDACVTLVDSVTHKLVQKFSFGDPKINAGHVAIRADKSFAVVSAPRAGLDVNASVGGITLRSAPNRPERMRSPKALTEKELIGESLSVCIMQDTVIVTTPEANLITFWSLKHGKLLGRLSLEFPRGVLAAPEKGSVLISYGRRMPCLAAVNLEAREVMPEIRLPEGVCSGSHLYAYQQA
jgi:uncharacterized protein